MWYLVSISIDDFIEIENGIDKTTYKFQGKEDDIPVYEVCQPSFNFTTEIIDKSIASDFGEKISSIISKLNSQVSLIHFNTFLVKFNGNVEELMAIVKSKLHPKDKAAITPINNLFTVNYSPQENAFFDFIFKK
jgi:hypothetical protein